jgi:enamine deaminase RidA (YjgF/YER057c/UK114 family)
MVLDRINPEGLHEPGSYTHVVKAAGTTVYVAGQVGIDKDTGLAGRDDIEAQARQAFVNVGTALAAADATPADVAKITIYVVDYSPEDRPAINAARSELFGDELPASTLVGVQALAAPDIRIEVEAVAVLG